MYVPPKKNSALVMNLSLPSYGTLGRMQSSPTLASGDVTISLDGGAFTNVTNLPTALGKSVSLSLTAAEMNADNVTVIFSDQTNPPEWVDTIVEIQTASATVDEIDNEIVTIHGKIDIIDALVDFIYDFTDELPTALPSIEGKIDTIDTTLDGFVADVGSDGSGLTAIPWNPAWDTEVESEVTDALTAYDVATQADLPSEPPSATDIANEVQSRTLDANIIKVNNIDVNGVGSEDNPWGP